MTIEDRNLKAGTQLVARFKGTTYHAEVVEAEGGIRYRLTEAPFSEFKSLSAAGSQIMGGVACNGWRFWSIEGQETEPKVVREAKTPASADFRRIPGGRAWCNACCAAFKVEAGTTPTVCPQGHPAQNATEKAETEAVTA